MSHSFLEAVALRATDAGSSVPAPSVKSPIHGDDPSLLMLPEPSEDASEAGCLESEWQGMPAQPLFLAVRDGDADTLKSLLATSLAAQMNATDSDGYGLLHHSLESAPGATSVRLIHTLLSHGADVELRNPTETPLLLAAGLGRHDAVEALLQHGASLEARDGNGHTALARAEMRSRGWHSSSLRPNQPNPVRAVELLKEAEREARVLKERVAVNE